MRHNTKVEDADGTHRGRAVLDLSKCDLTPGEYKVTIGWRGSHAGNNFIGFTESVGKTKVFEWNLRLIVDGHDQRLQVAVPGTFKYGVE